MLYVRTYNYVIYVMAETANGDSDKSAETERPPLPLTESAELAATSPRLPSKQKRSPLNWTHAPVELGKRVKEGKSPEHCDPVRRTVARLVLHTVR
jgi:hypothetical protein